VKSPQEEYKRAVEKYIQTLETEIKLLKKINEGLLKANKSKFKYREKVC